MKRLAVCILAAALVLSGCSLRTAGGIKGRLTLTGTFDDARNLVVGHAVQISDIPVGTVTGIRLIDGYKAKVTISVKDGIRIPAGTTATLAKESFLGEDYVRLDLPQGASLRTCPCMPHNGAFARTATAPGIDEISEHFVPIITAITSQDLGTLVEEAKTAFRGQGDRLITLVEQAGRIAKSYSRSEQDLNRILDSALRITGGASRGTESFTELLDTADIATATLAREQPLMLKTVRDLTHAAQQLTRNVLSPNAARLRNLLGQAARLLEAAQREHPQWARLADLLVRLLANIAAVSTPAGQGTLNVFAGFGGFLPGKRDPYPTVPVHQIRQDRDPSAEELRHLLEPRP